MSTRTQLTFTLLGLLAICNGCQDSSSPNDNTTGSETQVHGIISYGGQTYQTITIGTQTWMAENLNYTGYGVAIGECYHNHSDSCTVFGRLYTWDEAMAGQASSTSNPSAVQGICPNGWHIPSDVEWNVLINFVGGEDAGTKLKAATGWLLDGQGSDAYGFGATPAGYLLAGDIRHGTFVGAGINARFWSSSEYYASAYCRAMNASSAIVARDVYQKKDELSVRCLKNP